MHLTSFTDFALRALVYMATLPEGKMTNITEVTEIYGVSRHHMVKVIHQLSREGFIYTSRGKNGGIRLGMPAQAINIGKVVRQLEPLQLVNCDECAITPACRLKAALHKAMEQFLTELDTYTLADIVKDNNDLYKILITDAAVVTTHS